MSTQGYVNTGNYNLMPEKERVTFINQKVTTNNNLS